MGKRANTIAKKPLERHENPHKPNSIENIAMWPGSKNRGVANA